MILNRIICFKENARVLITITDLLGRVVDIHAVSAAHSQEPITLQIAEPGLKSGSYIVRLSNGMEILTRKLIIQ